MSDAATGAPLAPPRTRVRGLVPAALLVLAVALAVYANAVPNGFALDDVPIIQQNELVTEGAPYGEIWTSQYWPDLPTEMALYRPLTVSTYRLEWGLWNGSPRGFHATNVLLHGLASVLVLHLLVSLGAGWGASLAGALVFAVHPVHVEAVANVVGRAEVLATLSVLAGILLHRRLRSPWPRRLAVGAVFFIGLASKESAVVLPLLLLASDALLPVEDTAWSALKARIADYLSLAIPLGGYLALRFSVLGLRTGTTPYPALEGTPTGTRVWTAIATLPEHLRLLFWPADLISDYGPPTLPVQVGFTPDVAIGLVVVAGALLAVVSCIRRGWHLAALGILWYGLSVLPVSNLVVPVGVMLAERTLYLPSAGFAAVLAAAVGGLFALGPGHQPRARLVATVLVVAAIALGAARTVTRNPTWRNQAVMLETLVEEHPEHYLSFAWRGDRFRDLGQLDRAVESYETALSFAPGHDRVALRLSQYLMEAGDWERALEVTEAYLDDKVKMGHVQRIRANLELGRIEAAEAALDDARAFLSEYPELFPDSATFYGLKGLVLRARGDSAAAAAALATAAAIQEGEGAGPP